MVELDPSVFLFSMPEDTLGTRLKSGFIFSNIANPDDQYSKILKLREIFYLFPCFVVVSCCV